MFFNENLETRLVVTSVNVICLSVFASGKMIGTEVELRADTDLRERVELQPPKHKEVQYCE